MCALKTSDSRAITSFHGAASASSMSDLASTLPLSDKTGVLQSTSNKPYLDRVDAHRGSIVTDEKWRAQHCVADGGNGRR